MIEHMDQAYFKHTWRLGERFKNGYNQLVKELDIQHITDCIGLAPRTVIRFHDNEKGSGNLMKSYFQQECFKRGEFFYGVIMMCLAHTEEIVAQSLKVYSEVLELLADAVNKGDLPSLLEGPIIQPIFRKV